MLEKARKYTNIEEAFAEASLVNGDQTESNKERSSSKKESYRRHSRSSLGKNKGGSPFRNRQSSSPPQHD